MRYASVALTSSPATGLGTGPYGPLRPIQKVFHTVLFQVAGTKRVWKRVSLFPLEVVPGNKNLKIQRVNNVKYTKRGVRRVDRKRVYPHLRRVNSQGKKQQSSWLAQTKLHAVPFPNRQDLIRRSVACKRGGQEATFPYRKQGSSKHKTLQLSSESFYYFIIRTQITFGNQVHDTLNIKTIQ